MRNKYSSYLEELSYINDVEVWETGDVKCNITVGQEVFSLLLTKLSDNALPYVFLCNPKDGIAQKPHFLHIKKNELIHLCLSVREDISVRNKNYKEVLDYTLTRVIRLLTLNEDEEKREFRKEFLYFWNRLSKNDNKYALFLNSSSKIAKLKIFEKKTECMLLDQAINVNDIYFKDYKQIEADVIYIPLINSSKVVPPLDGKLWDSTTIENILDTCISDANIEVLEQFKIHRGNLIIVFEMLVPETLPITFVLKLTFSDKRPQNIFAKIDTISSIEYISSQRFDSEYLFKRIGINNKPDSKKVIVIGAGSLGSYIISELPKIGITTIGIIDDEDLSIENIMRHSLGANFVNYGKAFGLSFNLQINFPQLVIKTEKTRLKIQNIQKYSLEQYDVIVVATGGTDFMLSLNKYFHDIKFEKPVLFSWIEAKGMGVHALLVDYNKKGCYQCLYTDVDINKAHIGKENFEEHKIGTGCGAVFNSYGNIVLLKGTAMILEKIDSILNGNKFDKNPLFSVKTSKTGSDEYEKRRLELEAGSYFYISEGCEICGA